MSDRPVVEVLKRAGGPVPPTTDELAAIIAAVELCWPVPDRSVEVARGDGEPARLRWRMAGRWWTSNVGC